MTPGLSTAQKLAVARGLFHIVVAARRLAGRRGTRVVCRRRGVRWQLDLEEGVQLALYLGVYERTTSRRLLQFVRPGAIVVDVGANVGVHTLPLARQVGSSGRVIAVEPTDGAFARLRANCALNPDLDARIVAIHAALGRPGGESKGSYYSSWPVLQGASRHPTLMGVEQGATGAAFFALDDLVASLQLSPVALIKIDVDGLELEVLHGAARILARDRPTVVFEVCPHLLAERGESGRELVEYFARRDYELLDERSLAPVGSDVAQILAAIPAQGGRNFIARPRRAEVTAHA